MGGVNVDSIGKEYGPIEFEYDAKDVILYALGVGCDNSELDFVYENQLKVLPTFAVVPCFKALVDSLPLLGADLIKVLHGEQRIELFGAIPVAAKVTSQGKIKNIYDKGKGALCIVGVDSFDEKGNKLFSQDYNLFVRGAGGFGGDRGPSGEKNVPPERAPDQVVEYKTLPLQNLIYRLSGDRNPLHIDPNFAAMAGYDRPILHGLCTYGHAGRAVLNSFCGGEPEKFKSFEARFSGVVFPGETIITEMWKEGAKVILRAKVAEREGVVLSGAAVEIAE